MLEENPTPLEAQEAQRLLILTFLDGQQRHMDNAEYLLENVYDYVASSPIRFTKDGTVNRGQTLNFPFADVIIHLGNGSISYE